MRTLLVLLLLALVARLRTSAQSTNETFKMRGTVVGVSRVDGMTFANPHRFVRLNPPHVSMTVRVEAIEPQLTNYPRGSLVAFDSGAQTNFFPREIVRDATYDFTLIRLPDRSAPTSFQFQFKGPPKLVGQANGSANRSQPIRSETNRTSAAAGSVR